MKLIGKFAILVSQDGLWPLPLQIFGSADTSPDKLDAVDGMPISLQLVAGRLQEEKLLSMTKIVLGTMEDHVKP
jgi:Asp-tRNA(Asn)/Glu-tRNA(Gln) amidotransferase A subunit family amidase